MIFGKLFWEMDRNPPRSKLRPSRNGRVCGKGFVEFRLLDRAFVDINRHTVHFPSTLPFREGRYAVPGWVPPGGNLMWAYLVL